MYKGIGIDIDKTEHIITFPGNESCLLDNLIFHLWIIAEPGRRYFKEFPSIQRVSNDPFVCNWVNIDVLAKVWREHVEKLEDVFVAYSNRRALNVAFFAYHDIYAIDFL